MAKNIVLSSLLLLFAINAFANSEMPLLLNNGNKSTEWSTRYGKGVLKSVEDAGYPMAVVTIEMTLGGVQTYLLNLAGFPVAEETLNKWVGKKVNYEYNRRMENALLDVRQNGKTLIHDDGGMELPKDLRNIRGILKGAKTETAGDLPSTISITDKNNVTKKFDYYVTRSLVKANGTEVVGYYEERLEKTITGMSLVIDDDINNDFGLLTEVEDSGYPIATLRIEFPERKFSEYFSVNMEEIKNVDINKLRKWVGRYFNFAYTSEPQNALLDIRQNGKSLLGENNQKMPKGINKITGVLGGASEASQGDLPGTVNITTVGNEVFVFEFYITPEVVVANGTTVTGYYDERYLNIIKKMEVRPK